MLISLNRKSLAQDGSKTIDFNEFSELYQFVDNWVRAFHAVS